MTPERLPAAQEVRPWEDAAGRVIPPVPARLRGTPERRVAELQPTPPVTDDPARAVRADARAGDIVADAVRRLLDGSAGPVVVLAGTGRTGAVGVAAAAALVATGTEVRVERAAAFDGRLRPAALVLDAVTGRGLDGPLRAPQLDLVLAVQQTSAPVVSIDLPSGMHPQRGLIGHAVSADITLVLGAPAAALFTAGVAPFVGDLYLVGVADDPTGGTDPLVRILPSEHLRGGRE
jgi:NAD(P)H-hydrate repair Nnr-like enzyme with NAD(P)H-hydrate epimerase domain